MGDVDALEADGPAHQGQQARQRRQERRLAGPVGAEDREDLPAQGEVQALEDLHPVVAAAQAADLDDGRPGRLRHDPLPGTSRRPCGARGWTAGRRVRTTLPSAMKWTCVAEVPDDVEVVLDDDHRRARGGQLPDHVHDLLGDVVRQAGGRLVEQEEAGLRAAGSARCRAASSRRLTGRTRPGRRSRRGRGSAASPPRAAGRRWPR